MAATSEWVFIAPGGLKDHKTAEIISVKHPRTGGNFKVMVSGTNVLELQRFNDSVPRSWLLGGAVQQDGSFYLATPFDALFLVLPHLPKERFCDLEHVLEEIKFPEARRLLQLDLGLERVCDLRPTDGTALVRVNAARLEAFLFDAVARVGAALPVADVAVGGSRSAAFQRTAAAVSEEARMASAAATCAAALYSLSQGIVCDLLCPDHVAIVEARYRPPEVVEEPPQLPRKKQAAAKDDGDEAEEGDDTQDAAPATKKAKAAPPKLSASQRALVSAAKERGVRSVASFFKKAS